MYLCRLGKSFTIQLRQTTNDNEPLHTLKLREKTYVILIDVLDECVSAEEVAPSPHAELVNLKATDSAFADDSLAMDS
jgi:hypothetical protein